MNILRRELRAGIKSLLIWCGIMVFMLAVEFSEFTVYYNNPELTRVIDAMPPGVIAALNMDAFNFTTAAGFFGVMSNYLQLIVAIAAAMWGAEVIAREERDKTAEFVLSLPVTRARLLAGKTIAALVMCAVLLGVTWGATLLLAQRYAPDAPFYPFVALIMASFALIQVVFLSMGILAGSAWPRPSRAGSVAVSILLATYVGGYLMEFTDKLDFVRYLSPYKYYDPLLMLHESRLETRFVVLALAVAIACLAAAFAAYERRDMSI
ncbi:MAG: ABC transporter permease subunit [Anaerolineae bacterium]